MEAQGGGVGEGVGAGELGGGVDGQFLLTVFHRLPSRSWLGCGYLEAQIGEDLLPSSLSWASPQGCLKTRQVVFLRSEGSKIEEERASRWRS